jgi:serine/threonine protein kinase
MTSFGKYQVLECIGEGGFGRVFRGYDPVLKRNVAIKTCSLHEATMRERFAREAEIAANLRHPNIVTVYDFGEQEGEPYIVQEYLDGEDLDRKIKREDALGAATVIGWLRQIADGLLFAHGRGVVHRDVKPGNLRVLPDGQIRIMDFGIAKLLQSERQLTQSGCSLGTVGYLAPEQLRGGDIDHRVDIFSFGVVAYELVARERPFDGDSVTEVMFRIAHEDPPPLRELAPSCSPRLVALIERCLQKAPENRFASFQPVIDELNMVAREVGTATPDASIASASTVVQAPVAAIPSRAEPRKRRLSPSTWGFIAAAFFVAVLGVINLFRTGNSATRDAMLPPPVDAAKAMPVDSGRSATLPEPLDTTREAAAVDSSPLPHRSEAIDTKVAATRKDLPTPKELPPTPKASAAPPKVSPTRVVLLVRSDLRIAAEVTEAALTEELRRAGYEVVDGSSAVGPVEDPGLASGTANAIARIGQANEAGTVLLIDASADARPFTDAMFTGSAGVSVRVYPTSTGKLDTSKRFEIGTSQIPGEVGPTESAAVSAAVRAASYSAARFLLTRLEELR